MTLACLFCLVFTTHAALQADSLFTKNWRFFNDKAPGAQKAEFDDSKWRTLDLPHDWAIEGPFSSDYNARCGGLPFHGTGWYRKSFTADPSWKGKTVRILFDGAMNEATVWINGYELGMHPFGYMGFEYDMSKYLNYDKENVISVRLTPRDLSSRWYPGAGLYRYVWLKVDEPIHVGQWGTFVTTPDVSDEDAVVQVMTNVVNKNDVAKTVVVRHQVLDPKGKVVAKCEDKITVPALGEKESGTYTHVANPQRWDLDTPVLYSLRTEVVAEGKVMDTYDTPFGIRTIRFTPEAFYLNNKKVRFNGVCLHHDNGPLGSAINYRADERKLQIMKDMGVNAIRTSHNPVAPHFLDICDRLGLVVLDEAFDEWTRPKIENGYSNYFDEWAIRDITDMIRRDRNHPSIIMWSTGNEILEQSDKKQGFMVAKLLADACRNTDPTRPNTVGFNYYPQPYPNNLAGQFDIVGMNYKPANYAEITKKHPEMCIYGSETSSVTSSRGVYHLPIEKYEKHKSKQVTSYDIVGPVWAYPPDIEFHFLEENPRILGQFIWTGFDYLGEPTPYGGRDNSTNGYWNDDWPSHASYFGAVDMVGLPKDRFYLYQSEWSDKPMVHLLPHWNWKGMEGQKIPVYCYTNCDEAELFLNGKSLGKRVKGVDKTRIHIDFKRFEPKHFDSPYRLSWEVPYEAGELTVKAYKKGMEVLTKTINTAGRPARIRLVPDRKVIDANGEDLSYVTVRIEDKHGNLCPNADNLVKFSVKGAGYLRAVGNGDATCLDSFQAPQRKAFSGMCMLIVQSKELAGEINITATSRGLRKAKMTLEAK